MKKKKCPPAKITRTSQPEMLERLCCVQATEYLNGIL